MNTEEIVNEIRQHHRKRRFAMKVQQKVERSLESYVRINYTPWKPDATEAERKKANAAAKALIAAARKGAPEASEIFEVVEVSDKARTPADDLRKKHEDTMAELAEALPVFPFVEAIHGAGAVGLAQIIGEAGDLSNYKKSPCRLWKRLGFAPYDGLAGSTWKRDKWRPRALTKDEWIENPFSGERYAAMIQIAQSLWFKQWIGKGKTEDGVGKPNGHYGQVYFERRQWTAASHPEWKPGRAHKDALRFMMKRFLKDLWIAWRAAEKTIDDHLGHEIQNSTVVDRAA